jgi:hypothetical protein
MSLHEAVEIQQREADLKKSQWPRLVAPALYVGRAKGVGPLVVKFQAGWNLVKHRF